MCFTSCYFIGSPKWTEGSNPSRTYFYLKLNFSKKKVIKIEYDNKTLLIAGLIICALTAMWLNFEQIALAIVSGLVGYLSKDKVEQYLSNETTPSDDVNDI